MSELSYEEKAKTYRELTTKSQGLKDTDPEAALDLLRQADQLFPNVEGVQQWITYLEAKVARNKAIAAKKSATPALAKQEQSSARAEQAAEEKAAAEKVAAEKAAAEKAAAEAAEKAAAEKAAAEKAAAEAAEKAAAEKAAAEKAAAASSAAPVLGSSPAPQVSASATSAAPAASAASAASGAEKKVDQSQIKQWVRDAELAVREGNPEQAAQKLDAACEMLRAGGSAKVHIKLLERRHQILPDADRLFEVVGLYLGLGEKEKAAARIESVLKANPHHVDALEQKVAMARESGSHQLLSSLMQLSDAYDKQGQFQKYDQLQREIREVREQL